MPLAGFKDHNSMVMEADVAKVAAAYEAVRNTIMDAADFVDLLVDLVAHEAGSRRPVRAGGS